MLKCTELLFGFILPVVAIADTSRGKICKSLSFIFVRDFSPTPIPCCSLLIAIPYTTCPQRTLFHLTPFWYNVDDIL